MHATTQPERLANRPQGYPQVGTGYRVNRSAYAPRGQRGGRPQVHRNRSLVLNGNAPATNIEGASGETNGIGNGNTNQAWVTKTDRHLQLINSAIYEKESQNRARSIQESREQKMKQKDDREKARFIKHVQRANENSGSVRSTEIATNHEVVVQGIRFRVTKGGSKLMKVPGEDPCSGRNIRLDRSVLDLRCAGDLNAAKATPRTAIVGGVKFYRSKNGNLYRSGVIKAQRYDLKLQKLRNYCSTDRTIPRRTGAVKKTNELCKIFATTGIPYLIKWRPLRGNGLGKQLTFAFRILPQGQPMPIHS
jgi:hypothetical protein